VALTNGLEGSYKKIVMKATVRCRGFTLMEVMIVVALIGILGGMARLAISRATLRARGTAYLNDCRVFAEAFQRYAMEKGRYPADQTRRGRVPTEMVPYLRSAAWLRRTPLGGDYEWDDSRASTPLRPRVAAAIRVNGCTLRIQELEQIDRWYDDGNLGTGNLRATNAGTRVFYIIES